MIVPQMVLMGLGHGLHQHAGDRVDPAGAAAGAGRRRLGRQRRHPRARRHPRRRRGRQLFSSLYADHLADGAFAALPDPVRRAAQDSVAAAIGAADQVTGSARVALMDGLQASFMSGFHLASFVAAGICWAGALGALALPGRIRTTSPVRSTGPVEAVRS